MTNPGAIIGAQVVAGYNGLMPTATADPQPTSPPAAGELSACDPTDRANVRAKLLEITDLTIAFDGREGTVIVVDGVSLAIPRGAVVALVGESGCGKSLTAAAILRLIPPPGRVLGGRIKFDGLHLGQIPLRQLRSVRGNRIAMVFQDPSAALNPVYTIGEQIVEAIQLHRPVSTREARRSAIDLLSSVALPDPRRVAREYPHRLSGGMKQRAMIAMALACGPELLIADEPTTALDATTQREIIHLLRDLQHNSGMSILLITHDLGVVGELADDVYVMYAGRIVEHAPAATLLTHPRHPYTQALLACTPRLDALDQPLVGIPGTVPAPSNWPSGCRFHPRCPLTDVLAHQAESAWKLVTGTQRALQHCVEHVVTRPSGAPPLRQIALGHHVACWEAEPSVLVQNI